MVGETVRVTNCIVIALFWCCCDGVSCMRVDVVCVEIAAFVVCGVVVGGSEC